MERKRDLIVKLDEYQIPEPNNKERERTRKQLLDSVSSYRMTDGQFILGQLRFIKPYIWLGQLAVFMAVCIFLQLSGRLGNTDYRMYSVLSITTPLFLVFQIEELARVSSRSMLEIECATRYSIKKLMLSRMCILGITDLCILSAWVLFLNSYMKSGLIEILLYSLVPFNITVSGMFYLLKRDRGDKYVWKALSYTAFVCICFVVVPHYKPFIYDAAYQNIWLLLFAGTTGILLKTAGDVWKGMEHYKKLEEMI